MEKNVKTQDQNLIRASLSGDSRAFEKLYHKYQSQIYGTLAKRMSDRDTVDDLMQDTFFRAYRSLHTFKGQAAFSTWLTQIALNVYRSHLRSQQVRKNWVQSHRRPRNRSQHPPRPHTRRATRPDRRKTRTHKIGPQKHSKLARTLPQSHVVALRHGLVLRRNHTGTSRSARNRENLAVPRPPPTQK